MFRKQCYLATKISAILVMYSKSNNKFFTQHYIDCKEKSTMILCFGSSDVMLSRGSHKQILRKFRIINDAIAEELFSNSSVQKMDAGSEQLSSNVSPDY